MDVEENEEVGGPQRVEMRFVTSEGEEEVEAGPSSDITALVLRNRHGYQRAGVFLCVCGVIIFTSGMYTHTHTHTHAHTCTQTFNYLV